MRYITSMKYSLTNEVAEFLLNISNNLSVYIIYNGSAKNEFNISQGIVCFFFQAEDGIRDER